jgi:acyl carrier protein
MAVVWREVELPFSFDDRHEERDGGAILRAFLARDRLEGLDLDTAPVMRVQVIRTEERSCHLVWTCHHLFIDGWSAAIVLEDVITAYQALAEQSEIRPPISPSAFTDYLEWTAQRNDGAAKGYWRTRLAGFNGAPALRLGQPDGNDSGETSVVLDTQLTAAVQTAASERRLTVNALVQGSWALTLSRLFDTDDVVFGTIVAGRSTGVDGMERLVGYFANVVPVRVRVEPEARASEWLLQLRNEQFVTQPFEHAPLADIQAWSDTPGHRPLFETFVVVENFPSQLGKGTDPEGVSMTNFRSGLTSAYPLTIAVVLGDQLTIIARYDTARCGRSAVGRLLKEMISILTALVSKSSITVAAALDDSSSTEIRSLLTDETSTSYERPTEYRRPRTETERRIVEIWEDVLGLASIGVDDDYFALGGTSILAVGLFSRIESELGAPIPLNTLFSHPPVAELAELLGDTDAVQERLGSP